MKNVINIKVQSPEARNPIAVAMNARHKNGGKHRNKADKRSAQKARRFDSAAY